ncbi:MAG TPA: cobyric acid synthase [Nitrospira sp.]|nr:cobyric acid synthase [Nitrospira sp.]
MPCSCWRGGSQRLKASQNSCGIEAAGRKMAARTLMIQGTASHVGKSAVTAGLCRLFHRYGFRVAPFKAQNMSNNSFVTSDGKEIGRAQAVQAAACRVPPQADFNPVLIKPADDTSAQLIVGGEMVGSLSASDFGLVRRRYWTNVQEAFTRLAQDFDLIVLEGAGSPAEINLRDDDVANMEMARFARAPVLLVGDIDRGGVFASLLGTWVLLDHEDRRHLKAFLINKFRGERSLLDSGLARLSQETGMACAGVLPHWEGLAIPEEDSLGWDSTQCRQVDRADRVVIGIVDVPALSNFTDFEPLRREPDVELVTLREATHRPLDAVMFPGSKHTVQALRFVRARGFDRLARRVLSEGGTVGGICGGYQLLGRVIRDPQHVESDVDEVDGLGMLPVTTTFAFPKVLRQVSGRHPESGEPVMGYEVRMGRTMVDENTQPFIEIDAAKPVNSMDYGISVDGGRIFGTYLHGLFETSAFRRWWINRLRARKRWSALPETRELSLDARLDQWANVVERHISIPLIHRLLAEGA